MKHVRRQSIILFLLVLMFAAPGVAAYFFYFHPHWLSANTTNKGEFIRPPFQLVGLKKQAKWQLIFWSPADCDNVCMKQVDKLARIRLALGRRLYDVEVFLLMGHQAATLSEEQIAILREQAIQIMTLSAQESEQLSAVYDKSGVFIANPDQYLVLRFPIKAPSDAIFHDIKLLLTKG
ncbi:hypothetical protein N9Q05_02135 [bacterium]|nr:hypothetical protein [bacterium]